MQTRAYDQERQIVMAWQAERGSDYYCLECGGRVRMRGGRHQQRHFYHLAQTRDCRQENKSMQHLNIQKRVIEMLAEGDGEGEAEMECRFESINRVADIYWKERKIVFEVQCSPMSVELMLSRTADYSSAGIGVVWILYDVHYNGVRATELEASIATIPHYYSTIGADGKVVIYDQYRSWLDNKKTVPLEITLNEPQDNSQRVETPLSSPKFVLERLKHWPLFFSGDMTHRSLYNGADDPHVAEAAVLESCCLAKDSLTLADHIYLFVSNVIVRPYRLVLQALLEQACK